MKKNKEFNLLDFLRYILYSNLPNRNDNLKQKLIKLLFILSLVVFIVCGIYIFGYFMSTEKHENILEETRKIWHQSVIEEENENPNTYYEETLTPEVALMRKNPDFKGWITIADTKIDNPIYQTDNNEFYLNHDQNRKNSSYGALYFDYRNEITKGKTDKHLLIYGHEMKNGSMFGELKKLRSLDFYKNHPTFEFSTIYSKSTYKIYSIFVLNAKKSDDAGNIYNLIGQDFTTESGFNKWVNDAKERSLIKTDVDVKFGDDTVALVTCCDDFPDARLVVMARKTREGESTGVNIQNCTINPNPKYPRIWYEERNIEYPFEQTKEE